MTATPAAPSWKRKRRKQRQIILADPFWDFPSWERWKKKLEEEVGEGTNERRSFQERERCEGDSGGEGEASSFLPYFAGEYLAFLQLEYSQSGRAVISHLTIISDALAHFKF